MRTLLTIIVPQAKAAIVAVALFHFFFAWNDLFEPFIYLIGDKSKQPISVSVPPKRPRVQWVSESRRDRARRGRSYRNDALPEQQARDVGAHETADRVQLWLEGRGSAYLWCVEPSRGRGAIGRGWSGPQARSWGASKRTSTCSPTWAVVSWLLLVALSRGQGRP